MYNYPIFTQKRSPG